MDHTAFALRDRYAGTVEVFPDKDSDPVEVSTFQGGVLSYGADGRSFDIGQKLEQGDGVIVLSTRNAPLVELLRTYPALKEIPVPAGAVDRTTFEDWTVAMLDDELDRRELPKTGNKPDKVERLQADDRRIAEEADAR